jgi:hypothetical protein
MVLKAKSILNKMKRLQSVAQYSVFTPVTEEDCRRTRSGYRVFKATIKLDCSAVGLLAVSSTIPNRL